MKIIAAQSTFLTDMATGAHAVFANLLQQIFGPSVQQKVLGPITWADLGVAGCVFILALLANAVVALFFRHKKSQAAADPVAKDWRHRFLGAIFKPLHLLIWVLAVYVAVSPVIVEFPSQGAALKFTQVFNKLLDLGLFAVLFWLFYELTRVVEAILLAWASRTPSKLDELLVPLLGRSLRVIVPVLGIIFALPILALPASYSSVVAKGSSILIICMVAWIVSQTVGICEKVVLTKFDIKASDNLQARKVYTQVHVISKTVYVLIAIFTMASILMLFDEARRFGASILASAGVVGVIMGFAAQHTIANLFAGFQIALTQPMRLDDVVIVESEWGRVEEITLTYVVVHIWDDRRMVLPLSYFIEKPFQNWTRDTSSLLGSVLLSVDYSLPVEEARAAVKTIVEASALWDKRFWNLQISDASEQTMQVRVLATAADASKAWDLRCEIREKLIGWIQQNHPESLPKKRFELDRKQATDLAGAPAAYRLSAPAPTSNSAT